MQKVWERIWFDLWTTVSLGQNMQAWRQGHGMRITNRQLRKIIREQVRDTSREFGYGNRFGPEADRGYDGGFEDALENRPMKSSDWFFSEEAHKEYEEGYLAGEAEFRQQSRW